MEKQFFNSDNIEDIVNSIEALNGKIDEIKEELKYYSVLKEFDLCYEEAESIDNYITNIKEKADLIKNEIDNYNSEINNVELQYKKKIEAINIPKDFSDKPEVKKVDTQENKVKEKEVKKTEVVTQPKKNQTSSNTNNKDKQVVAPVQKDEKRDAGKEVSDSILKIIDDWTNIGQNKNNPNGLLSLIEDLQRKIALFLDQLEKGDK